MCSANGTRGVCLPNSGPAQNQFVKLCPIWRDLLGGFSAPKLSRSCPEVVQKLSRSCPEVVQKLSRSCPGLKNLDIYLQISTNEVVQKLSRSCPEVVQKLSRSCPGFPGTVHFWKTWDLHILLVAEVWSDFNYVFCWILLCVWVWEGAGPLRPVILTKYYIYTRSIKFALGISRCKIRGWGGAGIKHYLVFPVQQTVKQKLKPCAWQTAHAFSAWGSI
jgi:hypothetical protein